MLVSTTALIGLPARASSSSLSRSFAPVEGLRCSGAPLSPHFADLVRGQSAHLFKYGMQLAQAGQLCIGNEDLRTNALPPSLGLTMAGPIQHGVAMHAKLFRHLRGGPQTLPIRIPLEGRPLSSRNAPQDIGRRTHPRAITLMHQVTHRPMVARLTKLTNCTTTTPVGLARASPQANRAAALASCRLPHASGGAAGSTRCGRLRA